MVVLKQGNEEERSRGLRAVVGIRGDKP